MELIEIIDENIADFEDYISVDLQSDLERSFFYGLGAAEKDGTPLGAMVYELLDYDSDEDTKSRIHSFEVKNDEAAKLLMSAYKDRVSEEDVVESSYETKDEKLNGYMKSAGFESGECESPEIVLTMGDVKKMTSMVAGKKLPPYIQSLKEVSLVPYRDFIKNCLGKGRYGLLEDLAYLPLGFFERDVSSCSMADGKVDGVFLVRKTPSGAIHACFFTAFGADYQKNLGLLMMHAALKVTELYQDDVRVVIRRHNDNVKRLTDKFFPNIKGEEICCGRRKES